VLRFCKIVVSRFFVRIKDVQNSEKRGRVEFLKLQKDYSFINTIVFKSTNIITSPAELYGGHPRRCAPCTTTESQFTARTFTNGFEITGGDMYHRRLMTYGAPPGQITGSDEC
jgi:hypothetical protein